MRSIVKKNWRELEQLWQGLYESNKEASPFQSYEFLSYTGKGKPQRQDLLRLLGLKEFNLVLYNAGVAVAIAPLQVKKKSKKTTVYFRGHFTTAAQLDFIFHTEWSYEDFAFLMDAIRDMLGDVSFFLDRVDESSPTARYLKKYFPSAMVETHDCYYVSVPHAYEDWFNTLHKHMRKNLVRRENLLRTEHTDVRTRFICGDTVDKKTSRKMMDVYAQRFLEKNHFHFGPVAGLVKLTLIGILSRDKMTKWLDIAHNNFHLILYVDGEIAAFHSGIVCKNNRIVFSRLAINSKYARYGPGSLLMGYLMRYVIDENAKGSMDIQEVDLGQGGDNGMEYKKTHGGQLRYKYTFID
jgi:hypothetical protein